MSASHMRPDSQAAAVWMQRATPRQCAYSNRLTLLPPALPQAAGCCCRCCHYRLHGDGTTLLQDAGVQHGLGSTYQPGGGWPQVVTLPTPAATGPMPPPVLSCAVLLKLWRHQGRVGPLPSEPSAVEGPGVDAWVVLCRHLLPRAQAAGAHHLP